MSTAGPHEGKPLRIMMVSEFPYGGVVVGGVQSAVQILVEALSRRSDVEEVLLLSFRPSLEKDHVEQWNGKLTVLHAAGQRRFALPTNSFFDLQKAKKAAGQFRPDVVHGQGTGGHGDVAVRLGYPSVLTIHGVGSFETELRERDNRVIGPMRIWLTKRMIARAMESAGVVISISEFDRQYCVHHGTSSVVGIPNAVRYEFVESQPEFPDSQRIIFNGLLIPRKNVVGLVRAFKKVKAQVPGAILDLVGPKTDPLYYEAIVRHIDPSLKESIIFHGNMQVKELTQLVGSASVAVLFSIYENLPVAVAEALTLGKPVVSSRVGALAEMVKDTVNGFLVESGDEDALAERLVRLLNDRQLRRRMGLNARELAVQKWNPECVAAETVRAYRLSLEAAHT